MQKNDKLIFTIKELCRVCYTCVRDCPAKAIQISGGQAQVIPERCIGCGNCVKVCSQNAKRFYNSIDEVRTLLESGQKTAAILAPSFPADFPELEAEQMVGMLRAMGFDIVSEVSFGADLVAREYRHMLQQRPDARLIATTCPAIVSYVEKYHPALVPALAPIASPMVVTARVLRKLHGTDLQIVFIGPCFAKKSEAIREGQKDDVQAALTFRELRAMFEQDGLDASQSTPSVFDPPQPGLGALFPISGGLIQAGRMQEDLLTNNIVTANGKSEFILATKEFENGDLDTRLLEMLCCKGCINGPGMSSEQPFFTRRAAVSKYARTKLENIAPEALQTCYAEFADVDLSDSFRHNDQRIALPSKKDLDEILIRLGKEQPEDELDCGACGYETCREHAIAIHKGLAENEMCLPNTIDRLKSSLQDLGVSRDKLAKTQNALINAEKLAGMGQLSAGIAHEINNPLGVILLYSNLLLEDCQADSEQYADLQMIVEQAERCKGIVSGLLNFARKNEIDPRPTDIAELVDSCLKAIVHNSNIQIKTEKRLSNPIAEVDGNQLVQVLTNLVKNAVEAMPNGGEIVILMQDNVREIEIKVRDNGTGMSAEVQKKIFEPLFTTKQVGKGTGLGLAVTYGIIKMHRGRIEVESNNNLAYGPTGTTFTVTLPRKTKPIEIN